MEFLFIFYWLFGYIIIGLIDYTMKDEVTIGDLIVNIFNAIIWPAWVFVWLIASSDFSFLNFLKYPVFRRKQDN